MVVIRGTVDDLQDALDEVDDALDQTARKAKAAGKEIESALSMRDTRRDLTRTEQQLERVGDEITKVAAKAEALDGKDIDIDVDSGGGGFDLSPRTGGSGGGGSSPSSRKFEQDLSRLNDEIFALFNIFRKMSGAMKVFTSTILAAVVSFGTVIAAVGGLAAAATALATKLGGRALRRSIGVAKRAFVEVGRQFVDAMAPVIRNQIVPFLLAFAQELRAVIPELVALTRNNLPELTSALTDWVEGIVDFVQLMETVTDVFDVVKDGLFLLNAAILRASQGMADLIPGIDFGENESVARVFQGATVQEQFNLFLEAIRDLFGGGDTTVEGGSAEGLRGPTQKAVQRIREMRNQLAALGTRFGSFAQGANMGDILTPPKLASQRLSAYKGAFQEVLKLSKKADTSIKGAFKQVFGDTTGAPQSLSELKDLVLLFQKRAAKTKFRFGLGEVRDGMKGVIQKGQEAEKMAVQFVRKFRKLPGVALESKEAVRGLLQQFNLAPGRIDQIITRLRGMTPVVDKARKAFRGFLRSIGEGVAGFLSKTLLGMQNLEEQALRNKIRIGQLNQKMFELANKGTRQAARRMKLLRKEAARLRKETTKIGVAFQKMKDMALRALQQLIQKLIVAIGKAVLLKALNAIPGVSGASSLVGGIGQLLGFVGGGSGGSGGSTLPAGPPIASRTKQINIVPEALPNGDLGFAVRENSRRRERLGISRNG